MSMGMPAEKSMTSGRRPSGCSAGCARTGCGWSLIVALGVASVALSVIGPKILGHATDIIFAGVIGRQLPAGATAASRSSTAPRAAGNDNLADMLAADATSCPGAGIDFDRARPGPAARRWRCTSASSLLLWLQGYLLNGVVQRGDPAAARRRRGQAAPAAAALLRQPAARRAAQPGHQRHRQHRADAAADAEPAAHLAADRRRRARA